MRKSNNLLIINIIIFTKKRLVKSTPPPDDRLKTQIFVGKLPMRNVFSPQMSIGQRYIADIEIDVSSRADIRLFNFTLFKGNRHQSGKINLTAKPGGIKSLAMFINSSQAIR